MLNIILVTLIFVILFFALSKTKIKSRDILRIVLIIFALEVYVFNFNSLRLKFKNYEEKYYNDFEKIYIEDMEYDKENDVFYIKGDNPNIQIVNINEEIATVRINAKLINIDNLEYNLNYTDETSKNYRKLPKKTLVNGIEKSQYTTCYLSGKTDKIEICFSGEENTEIKIESIEINKDVPFDFSLIRVLVLTLISILVYKMLTGETFNIPYSEGNKNQINIIYTITMLFILTTIWISFTNPITSKVHDEFVDSIINGNIKLQIEPSEELINLENPYDATQRKGVDYIWDVALYEESYYVYFGILPFLLLSVPVKILTGITLPTSTGVLIFSVFTIINLAMITIRLYKK